MPLGLGNGLGLGLTNVAATGGGGGGVATTWAASTGWTLTNGNLTATASSASPDILRGSQYKTAGTAVITLTNLGLGNLQVGFANASEATTGFLGQSANSISYTAGSGNVISNSSVLTTVATATTGDIITWIANGDNTFTLKKNGTTLYTTGSLPSLGAVTPANSTNNSGQVLDLASGF